MPCADFERSWNEGERHSCQVVLLLPAQRMQEPKPYGDIASTELLPFGHTLGFELQAKLKGGSMLCA
jgi:hypothetical protein